VLPHTLTHARYQAFCKEEYNYAVDPDASLPRATGTHLLSIFTM